MNDFNFYLPLSKVEKTDDGCRLVSGYASTPALDLDGEIVSLDAVKAALPSYMEWRNIRQMHQTIAIGTAKEANVDSKGLYLTARIVDPAAVKLVDEQVLKGFSIGGKKLNKRGNTITEIDLIEISLVDRPANPECRIDTVKGAMKDIVMFGNIGLDEPLTGNDDGWFKKTIDRLLDLGAPNALAKREFSDAERGTAADKGEALPDGSFPIKSTTDLHNAVQAYGRAKDKDKAKAHIIQRAKDLGATDSLPADWEGSTKKEETSKAAVTLAVANPKLFGYTPRIEKSFPDAAQFLQSVAIGAVDKARAERINKGLGTVADLAYAFSMIRDAQRRLLVEGAIEQDGDDAQLATRLGSIASELASVIGQKAEHEGSEALFMTDEADLTFLTYRGEVAMTLTAEQSDLAKRASKAAQMHLGKVAHHLAKAGAAHAAGMKCLAKCGGMFGKAISANELVKNEDAMKHLSDAHDHFQEAGDHMEMAHNHLMKSAGTGADSAGSEDVTAAGPGFHNTHHISSISQSTLTEGEVPWYDATSPYAGKAAHAAPNGYVSKDTVEAMIKAAVAETAKAGLENTNRSLMELLAKSPAGPRARLFAMPDKASLLSGGTGEVATDEALLFEGIDASALEDGDSAIKAAGRMVSNMVHNKGRFGKSVVDPTFRGKAGLKS